MKKWWPDNEKIGLLGTIIKKNSIGVTDNICIPFEPHGQNPCQFQRGLTLYQIFSSTTSTPPPPATRIIRKFNVRR